MTVFESLLISSALIERRQRTTDGRGGWVIAYATIGTVDARIRPASSSEREVAMLEERMITHVLYVSAETDIARGDRVTIDDLVVEVDGVREPSKAGEHYEVDCLERQFEETA